MAVHTALRAHEILSLTCQQVDLRKRITTLEKTRDHYRRMIPLNDQVTDALRMWLRQMERPYVFCDHEGRSYDRIVKGFRQACKRAASTDFRFHDLPHPLTSHLVMRGVLLWTVQESLGHKTGQMTLRYTLLSTPHLQDAVSMLDTALSQAPSPQLE